MDINVLCDFLCLAHERNYREAADMQGITTSGLSRRIKSLEQFVGADLFDRSENPIKLTPAGEQFLELAVQLVSYLKQTEDETDLTFLAARFRTQVLPNVTKTHVASFTKSGVQSGSEFNAAQTGAAQSVIPPTIDIEDFRILLGSQEAEFVSSVIKDKLRSELFQSVWVEIIDNPGSARNDCDFLVEGTVACHEDTVHVTLHLANTVSRKLLLSKSFTFTSDQSARSLEDVSWEFAWFVSSQLRRVLAEEARRLPPEQRDNFQNFVVAHEALITQLIPKKADFEPAITALEQRGADAHRRLHIRGIEAFRAWMRDVEDVSLLNKADDCFGQAINEQPDYYPCVMALAGVTCFNRDFSLADHYHRKAQSIAPGSTLGLLSTGVILLAFGQHDEALEALRTAIKFEATALWTSPVYAALALYLKGNYAEAAAQIDVKRSPFPDAMGIKLAALAQAGERGQGSLLKAGRGVLPASLKTFQLARFPLQNTHDEEHLVEGLARAGITDIARFEGPAAGAN